MVVLTNSKPKEGQAKSRTLDISTYCRNLANYDKAGYKVDKDLTDEKSKVLIADFIKANKK